MAAPLSRKAQTQEKILDAALTLFSDRGFDAVTVEEIGTVAKVAHGTIFWHFKNKENLYLEMAKKAGEAYASYIHPAINKSTHPGDLVDIALLQYKFLRDNQKVDLLQLSLVFECLGPHPELKPALDAVNQPYYIGWKKWVETMDSSGFIREDVNAQNLIHTLTGGLGAIAIGGIVHDRDMTDAITEYSKMLVRGAFKEQPSLIA